VVHDGGSGDFLATCKVGHLITAKVLQPLENGKLEAINQGA
jgi:hypothetical protein